MYRGWLSCAIVLLIKLNTAKTEVNVEVHCCGCTVPTIKLGRGLYQSMKTLCKLWLMLRNVTLRHEMRGS